MGHIAWMDMAFAPLAFIDGLGTPEMMLIFVLVLVLFGGQKLPEFARGLGKSIREFKKAAAGVEEEFKRALDEDERKQTPAALTATAATTPATSAGAEHDYDAGHDDYHHGDYTGEHGATGAGSTDPAGPGSPTEQPATPEPTATTPVISESAVPSVLPTAPDLANPTPPPLPKPAAVTPSPVPPAPVPSPPGTSPGSVP